MFGLIDEVAFFNRQYGKQFAMPKPDMDLKARRKARHLKRTESVVFEEGYAQLTTMPRTKAAAGSRKFAKQVRNGDKRYRQPVLGPMSVKDLSNNYWSADFASKPFHGTRVFNITPLFRPTSLSANYRFPISTRLMEKHRA